jgi:DNA-binding response OmpR family regulator
MHVPLMNGVLETMPTDGLQTCSGQEIAFGPFRLYPEKRLLLCGDTPRRLGSRAWEILLILVERADEIVKKRDVRMSWRPATCRAFGSAK